MARNTVRGRGPALLAAGVALLVIAVVAIVIWSGSSTSSIDDTEVGGSLSGDRLHQVMGHLFDGVNTVHVAYVPNGGKTPATATADVVIGPPVQARITITTTTAPPQTGTVIIKDQKTYLSQPGFGSKWVLLSSADDGVSGTPAFGQTSFELRYLGPTATATYRGPATVDGTSTRQYVLSAAAPSASASPTSTTPQIVATVWIDDSGRLIKYTYSPTGQGDWVTATYSNWNEPVTVQAPPSKDVAVVQGTM